MSNLTTLEQAHPRSTRQIRPPPNWSPGSAEPIASSSAHHLPLLPDGHKCKNLHGHNYRIDVVLCGALDARGFVKDFAEIDAEIMPLIKKVDHRLLNEVEGLENPTAEMIAAWFFQRIRGCESVRVYENDECWAEVKV